MSGAADSAVLVAGLANLVGVSINALVVAVLLGRFRNGNPSESTLSINTVEVCQCKHGASFHDGEGCRETVVVKDPLTDIKRRMLCRCIHYVGPATSYVPELDGPRGPLNT